MVLWEYSDSLWDTLDAKFFPFKTALAPPASSLSRQGLKALHPYRTLPMREGDKLGKPLGHPLGFVINRWVSCLVRCVILHFYSRLNVFVARGKNRWLCRKSFQTNNTSNTGSGTARTKSMLMTLSLSIVAQGYGIFFFFFFFFPPAFVSSGQGCQLAKKWHLRKPRTV